MKKVIASLATGVVASFGIVATAPTASATHDCVTIKEYRRIERGFSMERVHRIFDVRGKFSSGSTGYVSREYNACGRYNGVSVDYERSNGFWRVVYKYAYF